MDTKILILLILALPYLSSCDQLFLNEPPLFEKNAEKYLTEKNVDPNLIKKLITRKPLTRGEAIFLFNFNNISVQHLLGCNTGTPINIIYKLAVNKNDEVRAGIASNPKVPIKILNKLRSQGEYTIVNDYLGRNPKLPQDVLREMLNNGETSLVSLALNPNCPKDLMEQIYDEGSQIERAWLSTNPNLTEELMLKLEDDGSQIVRDYLNTNKNYLANPNRKPNGNRKSEIDTRATDRTGVGP